MIKRNKKQYVIVLILLFIAISGFIGGLFILVDENFNIDSLQTKTRDIIALSEDKKDEQPKFLDLTPMSDTALYSEVFNILLAPDKYDGTIVKIKGTFEYSKDKNQTHTFCVVQDGPKCCSVGIEFRLKENIPLPSRGEDIILKGKYHVETNENGKKLVTLVNSTVKEIKNEGNLSKKRW